MHRQVVQQHEQKRATINAAAAAATMMEIAGGGVIKDGFFLRPLGLCTKYTPFFSGRAFFYLSPVVFTVFGCCFCVCLRFISIYKSFVEWLCLCVCWLIGFERRKNGQKTKRDCIVRLSKLQRAIRLKDAMNYKQAKCSNMGRFFFFECK